VARRLPIFPLGSVLFPGVGLPLHIFEDRYRVLMFDLTREGVEPEFGVVLIERGSEVGGGDIRSEVGTVARIVEAEELADGRWVLVAAGTARFRVVEWLEDDPYPLAMVEELTDEVPADLSKAEATVRRVLGLRSELGEPSTPVDFTVSEEPTLAAWQLCAALPVGPFDHQRLLTMEDPVERMSTLVTLGEEEAAVLAYRLGGG
jgi:Lon protease-like protein